MMITRRRVICYDVSDDAARRRVEKLTRKIATRVQKSVFEGVISDETVEKYLSHAVKHIDTQTDSVRVYRMCAACSEEMNAVGYDWRPRMEGDDIVV